MFPSNAPNPGDAGVRFTPPPEDLIPDIQGKIGKAVEAIGDADMGLFAVADRKGGWNAALVARVKNEGTKIDQEFTIVNWIGKEWGNDAELDWGVRLMWTLKFK